MFAKKEDAVKYVTDLVFERAENLGTRVLDNSHWKEEMTRQQVYDQLYEGLSFQLALSFDPFGDVDEYVSMAVVQVDLKP